MTITAGRHAAPPFNGHTLAPFTIQTLGPVSALPRQRRWRYAAWLAAVPIVLVNAVAFLGQLAFLRTRLPWPLAGQILVAVTLESVAVYLAWQAHLALTAGDSALRLRLAAYSFALVIGVMNYSHWMAAGWRPTFAAVTFGLMSVSSPWLWSVHSRRVSRDALKAAGDLEPHAVRLGMTRWFWHPRDSVRVMYRATWRGVTKPAEAIALLDDKPKTGGGDREPSKTAMARAALTLNPDLTNDALMELTGATLRTVQRARNGRA